MLKFNSIICYSPFHIHTLVNTKKVYNQDFLKKKYLSSIIIFLHFKI